MLFFDLVLITLLRCNAPFQTRGMKRFLASAVFQSAGRVELNGRGAVALPLLGPYDVFPDEIVCENYVFADSQRSPFLFVIVEDVLTQLHIHLAARR